MRKFSQIKQKSKIKQTNTPNGKKKMNDALCVVPTTDAKRCKEFAFFHVVLYKIAAKCTCSHSHTQRMSERKRECSFQIVSNAIVIQICLCVSNRGLFVFLFTFYNGTEKFVIKQYSYTRTHRPTCTK